MYFLEKTVQIYKTIEILEWNLPCIAIPVPEDWELYFHSDSYSQNLDGSKIAL